MNPKKAILLLIVISTFLSGCTREPGLLIDRDYIDSLADTIYAGEDRLVFLSNSTGGYYFDDAFSRPLRSECGYNRGERRIMSGYEIANSDGIALDAEPEFIIAHPEWIERRYNGGLVERIEMPLNKPGLILEIKSRNRDGIIFRPHFDFRHLDSEDAPLYVSDWDQESSVLTIARTDSTGGWLATACSEKVSYRESDRIHRSTHRMSELSGRPEVTVGWSPGEFLSESAGHLTFSFGWGVDQQSAVKTAQELQNNLQQLRSARRNRTSHILNHIVLRCENKTFERAFAWARLVLSQLIVDNKYLLTGIPYSSYPDGWHTCMALPGIVSYGIDPEPEFDILENIVANQNNNELSTQYGMFPGAIREDGIEYRVPEIAGLAAMAYKRLTEVSLTPDVPRDDRFATALTRDLMGTCRYRLKLGLVYTAQSAHFLYDYPAAPDRSGATIETQVLFYKVREFLKLFPRIEEVAPEMPLSLINGTSHQMQREEWIEYIVAGTIGDFVLPVMLQSTMIPYYNIKDDVWADRLVFPEKRHVPSDSMKDEKTNDDKITTPNSILDSRVSQIAALGWYYAGDHRQNLKLYELARNEGLIGLTGFRSLSPNEPDYESTHVYLNEDAPTGTKAKGDVLVWTNGMLADILATAEQFNSLWTLTGRLADRVINQGVTGALPEAENAEPNDLQLDIVGSPVHLTATAEFVRFVIDILLGIDHRPGSYVTIRPRFPDNWGETKLQIKHGQGSIILQRNRDGVYIISQTGIKPYLTLALETVPEPGERVLGSVRLFSGEEAEIDFVKSEGGRWKASTRRQ